jgi:excisionase family DNA binding protein
MADITPATPIADLPPLLTPKEAARWLGVSNWKLYQLTREGAVRRVPWGRRNLRLRREDVASLREHGFR